MKTSWKLQPAQNVVAKLLGAIQGIGSTFETSFRACLCGG